MFNNTLLVVNTHVAGIVIAVLSCMTGSGVIGVISYLIKVSRSRRCLNRELTTSTNSNNTNRQREVQVSITNPRQRTESHSSLFPSNSGSGEPCSD